MYRNDKLSCAAGCLISNNEYKPDMEHKDWSTLMDKEIVSAKHGNLIIRLQNIHDHAEPDVWETNLKNLATYWKLKWNYIK